MWLLQVLLDEEFYDEGQLKDEDRVGYERGEWQRLSAVKFYFIRFLTLTRAIRLVPFSAQHGVSTVLWRCLTI